MKNSVAQACVQVDTSTYIARVITYDFLENGIRMSFFRTPKNYSATD
ncbi:RAxF-45 family protein [Sporosarcina gallistercoris]|nr:RAxF-45 family protein [Sporosarcina gallistercoris]